MRLALWALALCTVTNGVAFTADSVLLEPHDGILVLRNGFVMSGRITTVGDTYVVSFGDSGEARLPRSAVEFECRTLDEAYRIKRDSLTQDDVQHHLQLADWCMRHGILARAADQLLIAHVLEPDHPGITSLERRFQSLASLSNAPPVPTATPGAVVQASHSVPAGQSTTRDLEPFLVQQFTVTVQPILLNRCATHACHGSGSASSFRLLRPSLGQVATSRLTHRNLQSTLAFIDRDQPEASRFLTMARQPHGAVSTALFEDKAAAQLDLITAWVRRLGMKFPQSSRAKRVADLRAASQITSNRAASVETAAAADESETDATARAADATADPFDPEDFNRRFHGKR